VKKHLDLIGEIQTDEWWQDVTLPMLERVRRRLRNLVHLIDRSQKKIVYTDFEDIIDGGTEIFMSGLGSANEFALFRQKARSFLRDHSDLPVVYKLRMNIQLDEGDIEELHSALLDIGGKEAIAKVSDESEGLGLFARSLVGLDRKAASDALSDFTAGNTLSAKQITFVEMVVAQLTEHGIADRKSFYDPPFTDVAPSGPSGLFSVTELAKLDRLLSAISETAVAT
jgi:type I restriction enzyme R subunit